MTAVFQTRNVLPYIPKPNDNGRGMTFPIVEAREYALGFIGGLNPEKDKFIIVGRRCARAFRMRETVEAMTWDSISLGTYLTLKPLELEGLEFGWIPHPSGGYNKWYKNPRNAREVRKFLTEARAYQR